MSVSYIVFKTNLLVLIAFTLATNLPDAFFLITSFFTTSISLLKSRGTDANLSIYNLSNSVFRLAKFVFNVKLEISMWNFFDIFFCYIIWKINFNINISIKRFMRFWKILTHFYTLKLYSLIWLSLFLSIQS